MSGWDRVDDVSEPWKERWEDAERRFFASDLYGLDGSLPTPTIRHPVAGEPNEWPVVGQVEYSERETRIGDVGRQAMIDVRRGRAAWPRKVFRHQTEQLGTIERRRGMGRRPSWTIIGPDDELTATIRESSVGTAAGRRAIGLAGSAAAAVVTLGHAPPYSRPRTEFVISGATRELGAIRDGWLLDLTGDPGRQLDRRLALAAFVSIVLAEADF